MTNRLKKGTALLKVSATCEEDVLKVCEQLQKVYKLILIGTPIPSDDGGSHCYINLEITSEVQKQ
jgi:hypothetical protein